MTNMHHEDYAEITHKQIYNDVELVREDLKELKRTLAEVKATKQDKVKPSIIIPLVLYFLSQTLIGVWWASDMTAGISTIAQQIEKAGQDRFYGRDGEALTRYMDTKFDTVQAHIEKLNASIVAIKDIDHQTSREIAVIRERIQYLEGGLKRSDPK